MTKHITFEYKGQMINYYNKMRNNANLDFAIACMSAEFHTWTIYYAYKK